MSDKDRKKIITLPTHQSITGKGSLPAHPPNKDVGAPSNKSGKPEAVLKAITRSVPLPPQKKKDEGLANEIQNWSKWVKENPQQATRLIKEWFDVEEK